MAATAIKLLPFQRQNMSSISALFTIKNSHISHGMCHLANEEDMSSKLFVTFLLDCAREIFLMRNWCVGRRCPKCPHVVR